MESWLIDVKRVRIPRPKFGGKCPAPAEPPKDYLEEFRAGGELATELGAARRRDDKQLCKATEELRRALHEKL